ncbi:protein MIZU-KUSSEI 1 [Humulus lupulus]|uniref:protein MIZU-KUSSEI 1 n=1 Tax=Humulus lupulus TaxID=3486 RepID=UPI002B416520|nr:protein MIZU-KUSSEI 1 [Humulus lupulus]
MRTIMAAKTPHDSSFSFSRRYLNFNWKKKFEDEEDDDEEILNNAYINSSSTQYFFDDDKEEGHHVSTIPQAHNLKMPPPPARKKLSRVSKLRSAALTVFGAKARVPDHHLGTRVVGTLFGNRRGHVHFAFQEDAKLSPAFLIELAMPTSVLVREMASGLVRIALECERTKTTSFDESNNISKSKKKASKLLEEPLWRTYCNGRKCGFAARRDCGAEEWKVLKAVEPISMGAGVLPECCGGGDGGAGGGGGGSDVGELMYMRARFERVVGSKDSEAFYMMNPDGSGGPELSIYLLRV